MTLTEYTDAIHRHVNAFFGGHESAIRSFDKGPIREVVPGFHAIEIAPGPRSDVWTYVSVGAGFPRGAADELLELVATAEQPAARHVELLAMTAHYHLTGATLGVGHTIPIGEPLMPGSVLDHLLVSLPYPFGPELEVLELGAHLVRL